MFSLLIYLLFGQTLAEINYNFIKNHANVNIKKAKDANRYEFYIIFKFTSSNFVKHPFLDKDTIKLNQHSTKKYNNHDVFSKVSYYSSVHNDDKKVYYNIIESFGYINGVDANSDKKHLALNSLALTLADMGINFENIKIDRVIPQGKMYSDGKIIDSFILK